MAEGGDDLGAGVEGVDGAGGAFEAADAVVGVQCDDEAVAGGAGLGEEGDVAGVEDVEAAVGEADGEALFLPAGDEVLDAVEGLGGGEGAGGGVVFLGLELVEDFGDAGGGGAEFADDDAGGGVGDVHGLREGAAGGVAEGHGGDDGVAGAGDVEDLAGAGGDGVDGAGGLDEHHAFFGAGDEDGAGLGPGP